MIDKKCPFRECYRPGMDHGTYVQGRGYTNYHGKPRPVCMENHLNGCPDPIPMPYPSAFIKPVMEMVADMRLRKAERDQMESALRLLDEGLRDYMNDWYQWIDVGGDKDWRLKATDATDVCDTGG